MAIQWDKGMLSAGGAGRKTIHNSETEEVEYVSEDTGNNTSDPAEQKIVDLRRWPVDAEMNRPPEPEDTAGVNPDNSESTNGMFRVLLGTECPETGCATARPDSVVCPP